MVKLTPALVYVRTKTSVEYVTKLNLWGCEVDDIGLCSQMPKLTILSLSVNKVSSLEPLQHCLALEELYIRKNKIEDITEIRYLKDLPNLRVLWMEENPCTENNQYRNKIIQMLPQLTHLDNTVIVKDLTSNNVEDNINPLPIIDTVNSTTTTVPFSCQSVLQNNLPYSQEENQLNSPINQLFEHDFPHPAHSEYVIANKTEKKQSNLSEWESFMVEENDSKQKTSPSLMFQSYHEGFRQPKYESWGSIYFSDVAVNRKRFTPRSQSVNPARTKRFENIISAIGVMLDELDQEGLRRVIDETQRRIKKKH